MCVTQVPAIAAAPGGATFVSEENGYEKIEHVPGNPGGNPATNMYPSQASTFIASSPASSAANAADGDEVDVQLSVALDRSKGVMSLSNGTLDVLQHRRGLPFIAPKFETVVLDDVDRIFTQMYVRSPARPTDRPTDRPCVYNWFVGGQEALLPLVVTTDAGNNNN